MFWAVLWVTVLPSLGSLLALNFLYSHPDAFEHSRIYSFGFISIYTAAASLIMGMALMPTTMLAIVSGFLFGWAALPLLVTAYSIASAVGYFLGRKLDTNSLEYILGRYPKAEKLIRNKEKKISQLIFLVRLSPVIPFAFSNLVFALMKISLSKVIWVGLWGMLPRTFMSFTTGVLAESLVAALDEKNNAAEIIAIIALILISFWGIYRLFKNG